MPADLSMGWHGITQAGTETRLSEEYLLKTGNKG